MNRVGKLFSLGIIAFILLSCPLTTPQGQPPVPQGDEQPPAPPPELGTSPASNDIEAQWALITKSNVEKVCLSAARQEAEAQGYSGSLVFSCGCTPFESEDYKSYNCDISAADGSHELSAACTKSEQACTVHSEQGTFIWTFEQLVALASGG